MAVLASLLRYLCLALWMLASIFLGGAWGLLHWNADAALSFARRVWAPFSLWLAGATLRVEPLPDVPWNEPHIYLMNHQSQLDIPCAFAVVPAPLRFVAKHTLGWVPFLGQFMWLSGMIFVNRSNRAGAVASLQRAGERIRAGKNIIAYPEGTRSKDGLILPFKKGPFVLAMEAGVPVVPLAVSGSCKVLTPGSMIFRPGEIRLKVGRPIPTAGRTDRDALLHEVRMALLALHREIGGAGGDVQEVADVGVEGRTARAPR